METRTPWVLNFDADLELEFGENYQRPQVIAARFEDLRARAAGLSRDGAPGVGYAFCPTPTAIAELSRLGVKVAAAPSFDILRRVNHRAFCHSLPDRLPHAAYASDVGALTATMQRAPSQQAWMVRRPFGFAGRGRKRFRGTLPENVLRWLHASFSVGEGVELVPWVERTLDFGQHGYLARDGKLTLGELTIQECDEQGAWLRTRRAAPDEVAIDERDRIRAMAERVASSLLAEGYFGPFGIDGFRFRDTDGVLRLHSCCDVNARYSMGWATGMGDNRPDLT